MSDLKTDVVMRGELRVDDANEVALPVPEDVVDGVVVGDVGSGVAVVPVGVADMTGAVAEPPPAGSAVATRSSFFDPPDVATGRTPVPIAAAAISPTTRPVRFDRDSVFGATAVERYAPGACC